MRHALNWIPLGTQVNGKVESLNALRSPGSQFEILYMNGILLGGVPVSLISRDKLVFRGDSSGTLVIYDTEKKTASSGVSIGRGPLLKLEAGEGNQDGLFVAQFNEHVELWDLVDV